MDINVTNVLLWLAGQVVVGAAIWGGIRSDIKSIHERITETKKATDQAHERIDRILERRT